MTDRNGAQSASPSRMLIDTNILDFMTDIKQIDFRQYRPLSYSRSSDRIHRTRFRLVSDDLTAFC